MGIAPAPSFDDSKPNIVMGYPSMDRYHHQQMYNPNQSIHAQVYSTKNSTFHDPENPYSQQQYNNDFYDQQQHEFNKPLVPEPENKTSFGAMMLILLVVIVACIGLMSLVMWFLFGTSIPQFEITSFKVTNFSASNTNFTGTWVAGFSVKNTNNELTLGFDHLRSAIFYKDTLMGIYTLESFNMDKKKDYSFGYNVSAEHMENSSTFEGSVLSELARERANGVMVFNVRLSMMSNFTSGDTVYRRENLRVICESLQVKFSEGGEGTYSRDPNNKCLIRLHGENMGK